MMLIFAFYPRLNNQISLAATPVLRTPDDISEAIRKRYTKHKQYSTGKMLDSEEEDATTAYLIVIKNSRYDKEGQQQLHIVQMDPRSTQSFNLFGKRE